MENLLVPYQAVTHFPCTRALVFAPHPDDEVFGCGGAIMRHIEQGIPVTVIIVSDGAYGLDTEKSTDYTLQRQQESIAAASILGYGTPTFWQYPDRNIGYNEKFVQEILKTIQDNQADLVYAPSVFEMHPDHRVIGMAVVEAVRRIGKTVQIALYEVGIPLHPNQLLDISDLAERKAAAMACFVSQNAKQRYDLHIAALNRYRTYTLPAQVTAAEAYIRLAAEELSLDPLKLYQSEYSRQKAIGLVLDSQNIPLVSVIIRNINRPTLSDALDSVALQTYCNIEVVLVNAKGSKYTDVGEWCGRFPIRMIDGGEQLNRSRAANVGLEAAQGKYLIFLDDDDWLTADHIENLVRAIESHPHIKVVYSGATCVDENNKRMPNTFGQPFDATRLLAGNYIPIHTSLFSKELIKIGCKVDETLDVYEDWDFWIQASMFTDFLYIDKITAVYRINPHLGSAIHSDHKLTEAATLKIYQKWLPRLNSSQISNLMAAVRSNQARGDQLKEQEKQYCSQQQQQQQLLEHEQQQILEHKQQIDELRELTKELEQLVSEKDNLISNRSDTIKEIIGSTSWKITHPMRWLVLHFRVLHSSYRKIRELATNHGGFKALFLKIWAIARQEGLSSLIKQFSRTFTPHANKVNSAPYQQWIEKFDHMSDELRTKMHVLSENFTYKPLISIIMPTYNSNIEWLTEAIESVRKQTYPHWELCIADDASTEDAVQKVLQQYEKLESRIKVVYRSQNGHISAASNSALQLATGEWIALLDHDDLLSEHALFWVVDALQHKPNIQLIYSDEDKIDEQSRRLDPYFKPDWNRELFYSQNMFSHLGVYHAALLKEIGGFRIGFEGSQDYDLALRCVERINATEIHHIPRILYHWRVHASSTALSADTKPYAMIAGERALNEHFQRQNIAATAELIGFGYRIHYALPNPLPLVTLIIPTRNGLKLLRRCIDSILKKTTYQNYEVFIIDNGSDDLETLDYLQQVSTDNAKIIILRDDRPFNYSALNNEAVKKANGSIIGLLNNDLEVISPIWLEEMISIALQSDVGAVGARLRFPDDTLQHAGIILGLGADRIAGHANYLLPVHQHGYFGRASLSSAFSAVSAACLVVRKSIYNEVGGLNEQNLQIAFNDVDFCLKLRNSGYHNVWTPYAELYHHESATRGHENSPEKRARFAKEVLFMKQNWGSLLLNDPGYNPNLTLDRSDFSLADTPRIHFLP
ncbi:MAG: glycosyltransferase [Pseudomonadota bacterium]